MNISKKDLINYDSRFNYKKSSRFESYSENYFKFLTNNDNILLLNKIYEALINSKELTKGSHENKILKFTKISLQDFRMQLAIIITKAMTSVYLLKKRSPDADNWNIIDYQSFTGRDDIVNFAKKLLEDWLIWVVSQQNYVFDESVNLRPLFISILDILAFKNVLLEKKINFCGKTYIRYEIKGNLEYCADVEINYDQFNLLEVNGGILLGGHYSLIYRTIKQNKYSYKNFKLKANSTIISEQIKKHVKIDIKALAVIITISKNLNHIYDKTVAKTYEETKKRLDKYIDEGNMIASLETQKQLSRLQNLLRLESVLDYVKDEDNIYIPFSFCFRGRTYYSSLVSITDCKELRYCLYQGEYLEEEKNEEKKHLLNDRIKKTLKNFHEYTYELDSRIKNLSDFYKDAILWQLVSLAETEKADLGKAANYKDFIKRGIKVHNGYWTPKAPEDVEKFAKISLHRTIIKEILEGGIIKKRLVCKDATASNFEHQVKILGSKNKESMKLCNLQSEDTWYDPYGHALDQMEEVYEEMGLTTERREELRRLIRRGEVKASIMRISYGAKDRTCEENLKKKIGITTMSTEEREEINIIIKKFLHKLREESMFTDASSSEIGKKIITIKILNFPDAEIDLTYYKKDSKQKDVKGLRRRLTYTETYLTDIKDERKIKQSGSANYTQAHDGFLVRWVLERGGLFAIHDSFLIDCLNVTYIIALVNEGMQKNPHTLGLNKKKEEIENIFSPFIII